MRRAAFIAAAMVALAGCAQTEPGTTEVTRGPQDLGQPLDIHVQNPTQRDAVLRFTLEGQDEFTFRMPAEPGLSPNVDHAYAGSVPPGSMLTILDVRLGVEQSLELPTGSEAVHVHVQVEDGHVAPSWSHEFHGYD